MMAYNTTDISVLYRSQGDKLPFGIELPGPLIVLKYTNGHLIDNTVAYRNNPYAFLPYQPSDFYGLRLSKSEVALGDRYELAISGVHNSSVQLSYSRDTDPVEVFTAQLDSEGRITFEVSSSTKKGVYHYIGFKIEGQPDWFDSPATITVR
jgi:hypothetical protein